MGFDSSPNVTTLDPNPASVNQVGNAAGDFFSQLFSGGVQNNPFLNVGQTGLAGQAGNSLQIALAQNPMQQTQDVLSGLLTNSGGQVVDAAQPIFQQNLQAAQGNLNSSAPGRFSTAFAGQGIGLAQNALQDFNLFQAQALQQGQQNQLAAGGLLNEIANSQINNLLGAGQFGLAQNMAGIDPFVSLLGIGAGFGRPSPMENVVQPSSGGLGGFLGTVGGGLLGSIAGPFGATVGSRLGSSLFGGGSPSYQPSRTDMGIGGSIFGQGNVNPLFRG